MAQFKLGFFYVKGEVVKQDLEKGFELLTLAANQNHVDATYHLGLCYLNGQGTPQDLQKAIKLVRLAADKNSNDALYILGRCNLNGLGVKKDLTVGLRLINMAAVGFSDAQRFLAGCYLKGHEGVKKDLRQALKYYQMCNQKVHDASIAELCTNLESELQQDEIHQKLINSFNKNNLITSPNIAIQEGVQFIQKEEVFVNTKLPSIINNAFTPFFDSITEERIKLEIFLTFLNKNPIVDFLRFIMKLTNTLLSSLQRYQKQNGLNYYGNIDTLVEWIVQVLIENLIVLPYKQFKIEAIINDIINDLNKRLPSLPPAGITYSDLQAITKNILTAGMEHSQNQLAGINPTENILAPTNRVKTDAIKNENFTPRDDLPDVTLQVDIKEEKNSSSSVSAFFNRSPTTGTDIKQESQGSTNKRKREVSEVSTVDTTALPPSKKPTSTSNVPPM